MCDDIEAATRGIIAKSRPYLLCRYFEKESAYPPRAENPADRILLYSSQRIHCKSFFICIMPFSWEVIIDFRIGSKPGQIQY